VIFAAIMAAHEFRTVIEAAFVPVLVLGGAPRADPVHALRLAADGLAIPPMPAHGPPPLLVLATDGFHTDDFDAGLHALSATRWGQLAVRIAIAIGEDDCDRQALKKFQGDDREPLQANSPEEIIQQIRWASEIGIDTASGASRSEGLSEW